MKPRYFLPIIFVAIYIALELFFLVNSGAGHGWGTGAMVIITLPLGLIALALELALPQFGLILLLPVLGLVQYVILGYVVGILIGRKKRMR